MGFLVADCPHCRVKQVAQTLRGEASGTVRREDRSEAGYFVLAECGDCGAPSVYEVRRPGGQPNLVQRITEAMHLNRRLNEDGVTVELFLPPPVRDLPAHLPEDVARAMRQAETNFHAQNCEEPAAVFYGRTIELAVKARYPDVSGGLFERIAKLAERNVIPQAMADWAHEVRLIRNAGAHEGEPVQREDLIAARDFTDAFLRYLITMPEMVAARRARPGEATE